MALRSALGTRFVIVAEDVRAVLQRISKAHLDVLVYPDIGLDPITLVLAQSRLAPVQAQWWGHPVTSGSPHIDYFLGLDEERVDASDQYMEQLVRFRYPNVSPKIQRSMWRIPVMQGLTNMTDIQRETFEKLLLNLRLPQLVGMPLDAFSFGAVLGRAYKFSGPFLDTIARLLYSFIQERYKRMYIVVVAEKVFDSNAALYDKVLHSLEGMEGMDHDKIEEAMQRLRFLDYAKYFDLLAAPVTRVVLDTFPFGGCLSTLDAFSHGLPVVTLNDSSATLRGLFTTSMYTHMKAPVLQKLACVSTQQAYIHAVLKILNTNITVYTQTVEAIQRGYITLLGTSTALTDEFVAFLQGVVA